MAAANSLEAVIFFFLIGGGGLVLLFKNAGRIVSNKRRLVFTPKGLVFRDKLYGYENVKSVYWESQAFAGDALSVQAMETIYSGDVYFVYGTEKIPLQGRINSDAGAQFIELLQNELRERGAPV